jgi:hypothetical protein
MEEGCIPFLLEQTMTVEEEDGAGAEDEGGQEAGKPKDTSKAKKDRLHHMPPEQEQAGVA